MVSGWNMISDDKSKLNKGKVNRQLRRWLKTNYYSTGKEWQYKNISPKIICEENLMPNRRQSFRYKIILLQWIP